MSTFDHASYVWIDNDLIDFIIMHVNGLVIRGDVLERIQKIKSMIDGKFKVKNLGDSHCFIGIEIAGMMDGVWLSQQHYAMMFLKKFGMVEKGYPPLDSRMRFK